MRRRADGNGLADISVPRVTVWGIRASGSQDPIHGHDPADPPILGDDARLDSIAPLGYTRVGRLRSRQRRCVTGSFSAIMRHRPVGSKVY